jgi:hypothetical protein
MKQSVIIIFFASCLLLSGCAGSLPHPTANHVSVIAHKFPFTVLSQLEEGRTLYIQKCSGCHTLRLPSEFTEEKWGTIIQEMKMKAKLDEEESRKVLQYIVTIKVAENNLQK